MRYALSADQMRAVEARAAREGIATLTQLMERAGMALAREVMDKAPDGPVAVVCGTGNNGGDGWVAARHLVASGRSCRVITLAAPDSLSGDARAAAEAALREGVPWEPLDASTSLAGASTVVDAVLGFGFHAPLREPQASAVALIAASGAFVVAADVPSGVDSDTGAAAEPAVFAHATVTFSAPKPGLLIYPGARHAGEIVVADLGIPSEWMHVDGALEVPTAADLARTFPWPQPEDHKGSRGRVALVTGSLTYPGAAVLTALGALRLGSGFTVAVVPEPIADLLRASAPNLLVRPVPAGPDGALSSADAVLQAVADADAVVVGPGLTTAGAVAEAVSRLIAEVDVPLVLDADALNALGAPPTQPAGRSAPIVITPHPGEAARMLGMTAAEVQSDRISASRALCGPATTCLLKGPRTIVVGEGRRAVITAGNAALARAGSGDVLAGMIGTLLAQKVGAYDAAVLAAFLHGRAGEIGSERMTVTCFTSADIPRFLPKAVREVTGE